MCIAFGCDFQLAQPTGPAPVEGVSRRFRMRCRTDRAEYQNTAPDETPGMADEPSAIDNMTLASDHCSMDRLPFPEGITFDDVLLIPDYSSVTPDQADTSTRLTRNI